MLLHDNKHIHSNTTTNVAAAAVAAAKEKKKDDDDDNEQAIAKGGVACPFPWRLHTMLEAAEQEGLNNIVSWQPHGRAFMVKNPSEFVEKILHRFFSQTKYPSFQRQLNLYGFSRFAHGRDKGAYHHPCFVRGKRSLVRGMIRRKIKGTKVRRTMHPSEEPDFYATTTTPEWKNAQVVVEETTTSHQKEMTVQHDPAADNKEVAPAIVVAAVAASEQQVQKAAPKVVTETKTTPMPPTKKKTSYQDSPITTILPVDMILDDDDDDDDFMIPDVVATSFDRPDHSLGCDENGCEDDHDNDDYDENGLPGSDFDFWGFLDDDDDDDNNNNNDPLLWDNPLLLWDMNFTPKPTMFAI